MDRNFKDHERLKDLRKKAERRMRNGEIDPADDNQSELMRLNHELEVHRVELKMQNEELRRTVSELENSRNEFADLYQSAPVAFLNVSSDGLIKDANEAAFHLLPWDPKFLVGSSFVRLVFPEDQHIYFSYLRKAANAEMAAPCELRLLNRKAGQIQYVQLRAAVKADEQGRLRYWRLALVDISERKQAEAALKKEEEIFKLATSAAKIGTYSRNLQTGEDFWSPEFMAIYGYSPGDTLPLKGGIPAAIHPEDRPAVLAEAQARLKRTITPEFSSEHRIILPHGEIRWVMIRGQMEFDNQNRPLRTNGIVMDITERKRTEETVIQQRELLKGIFDNIPVLLVLWNLKLQRFTLNRYAEEVLGLTTTDANEGDFMSKVYPDEDYRERVVDYMRSLEFGWREWVVTTKDGKQIPIKWANVRLSDDSMIGIGVDLRERKQAEMALELNLAQFRALFNQMTEGLAIFDPEGNLLDMNPAALAIHGFESVEKIQQHFDTLANTFELCDLKGDPLPTEKWPIGRVVRGETFNAYEVQVRNHHTGKSWIGSYGGTPVRDSEGNTLICIVTLHDITVQKRAEAELRESEERFRTMANGLPLIVWLHDAEGKQQFVNQTFLEFFGVTMEELQGERWRMFMHPEDAEAYSREFFACVEERRPFNAQVRVRRADNKWRYIESWARPRFSSSGKYLGFVGTSADITKRKRAEEFLRGYSARLEREVKTRTAEISRRNQQLKELNFVIKKMTKSMIQSMENDRKTLSKEIHDSIGGSLAGIKMLLENRLEGITKRAPEGITSLETIVGHLVDAIKESKKISNKMRPMALDEFGLKAALSENITRFKEFYPKIKIGYQIQVSPDSMPDEIKTTVYRVIQEALNNVGKHSRATSANVELAESKDKIMLKVEDNGIGFDVPINMDAGQPLQGYGLISMKERVEICRGTFNIESSPGKGTRIFASIPKSP